jgi:hypothetical protein
VLQRLQGIQHLLWDDILGEFGELRIRTVVTPRRTAMATVRVSKRVISCSARRLICKSKSARFWAWVAIRFCVIRINVDRKMASTEATMANTT